MIERRMVVVIGGGGHASVIADTLRILGHTILGCIAPNMKEVIAEDLTWLGSDDTFLNRNDSEKVWLANGIGMVKVNGLRKTVFEQFNSRGYRFINIVHPSAIVSEKAVLEEGVQIMAGAIIQTGAVLKRNTLINTRASIDHHAVIGSNVHVAPGATICGSVKIGDSAFIGAGATIIQGVQVGRCATVGAGAVVIRDVLDGLTVKGIPAKE